MAVDLTKEIATEAEMRPDDLQNKMRHDLLEVMQTAKARKGMKKAFNASPEELGSAAVKAGRKKR